MSFESTSKASKAPGILFLARHDEPITGRHSDYDVETRNYWKFDRLPLFPADGNVAGVPGCYKRPKAYVQYE